MSVKVGITGGIGSGKSVVSRLFEVLGIPIYISDQEAKRLTATHPEIRNQLIQLLGDEVYANNELNKPFLANYLFASEENAERINRIIHPVVKADFEQWAASHSHYPIPLKNETLMNIINTQTKEIPSKELEGSIAHSLQNKNRFLYSYEGANGVKTGYTNKAGHCFVGAANKEDMELIAVALGAGWGDNGKSRKYTDVIKMMNYGFNNFKKYKVLEEGKAFDEIAIIEGEKDTIVTIAIEEVVLPLTQQEADDVLQIGRASCRERVYGLG